MAERVHDLRKWLSNFKDMDLVAVDDGGLTLVILPAGFEGVPEGEELPDANYSWYEIGGIPLKEEEPA